MKNTFFFILTILLVAACSKDNDNNSAAVTQSFTAALNGTNAIPTNSSSAKGVLSGTYDSNTKVFNFSISYSGIIPTSGAIHMGLSNVVGPPVFPLGTFITSPYNNSLSLTDVQLDTLTAGIYYVNIISAGFPDGEIRGQIIKK